MLIDSDELIGLLKDVFDDKERDRKYMHEEEIRILVGLIISRTECRKIKEELAEVLRKSV